MGRKKGYSHSLETKAKITASITGKCKSQACKEKLSLIRTGWKVTEETKLKLSKSHMGKSRPKSAIPRSDKGTKRKAAPIISDESRLKMSLAGAHNVAEGKTGYKLSKRYVYNGISFRSSWECKVAEWFDLQGWIWCYELDIIVIDREAYLPDFIIFNKSGKPIKIIEVKGYFPKDVREKLQRFQDSLPLPLEIWDESKLNELGILQQEVKNNGKHHSTG